MLFSCSGKPLKYNKGKKKGSQRRIILVGDEMEGSKMKSDQYCYWCGELATSREHVPPKCLFPEDKDINSVLNQSFRENLITVPSCNKHNLKKSNDDQYLMVCLASKVGNNDVAYVYAKTKIARTIERDHSLLNVKDKGVFEFNGITFPVLMVEVKTQRLIYSFESIARALYYYEYNTQFTGECMIISKILINPDDNESKNFLMQATSMMEQELPYWETKVKGYNSKIFTYQFSPVDDMGVQTIALTFYEGITVYAILSMMNKETKQMYKSLFQVSDEVHFNNKFSNKSITVKGDFFKQSNSKKKR